jgi:phenylpyruvate tautomerase PptA (4-oxalocrotonate tautomerase family)
MPFVNIMYSGDAAGIAKKDKIAQLLSKAVAKALDKEEEYVMLRVTALPEAGDLYLGGSNEAAAIVTVQSIGGSCKDVCGPITELLVALLGMPDDRIYITFSAFSAKEWALGFNTFG